MHQGIRIYASAPINVPSSPVHPNPHSVFPVRATHTIHAVSRAAVHLLYLLLSTCLVCGMVLASPVLLVLGKVKRRCALLVDQCCGIRDVARRRRHPHYRVVATLEQESRSNAQAHSGPRVRRTDVQYPYRPAGKIAGSLQSLVTGNFRTRVQK